MTPTTPVIIDVQSVKQLPGRTYSPAGELTLERILDRLARKYPAHQAKIYRLGGLLHVAHPESEGK